MRKLWNARYRLAALAAIPMGLLALSGCLYHG